MSKHRQRCQQVPRVPCMCTCVWLRVAECLVAFGIERQFQFNPRCEMVPGPRHGDVNSLGRGDLLTAKAATPDKSALGKVRQIGPCKPLS